MGKEFIDLYELQSRLKEGVEQVFPAKLWLKAEISAVKARPGGHCYLELSQSGDSGLVAKAQAVIWASRYRVIAPFFESVTGTGISEGMLVLVRVQVSFSQLYGLSLVIDDIDPDFSIGVREKERLQTIARLTEEGLMDMQKELPLVRLPYRLAVVSAQDAAGYRDFMRHLQKNPYGFVFHVDLYPALMQGASAAGSMLAAMDAAVSAAEPYDALLILRGGGARLDLSCYDDYSLASGIARCPVPVFTAVGHDQDVHVCDMVAWKALKTPTALADEFVDIYADEDRRILYCGTRLKQAFLSKISAIESRIQLLESRIAGADPRNVLRRGYVLTLDASGRVLKSVSGLKKGDRISLMYHDGTLTCGIEDVVERDNTGRPAGA